MRVGVFFQYAEPDAGGGFTFQEEILNALKKVLNGSKHSFVIFCNNRIGRRLFEGSENKIKLVFLKKSFFGLIQSTIKKTYNYTPLGYKQPRRLKRALLRHNIDIFWFLTPHDYCQIDIPFITIVWDLQHRLQPWFPEVSSKREWDNRDRYYRSMLQRSTIIITGNEAGKKEIMQFYNIPSERIKLLPHPTPSIDLLTEEKSKSILRKYGLSKGFLIYPAQFWSHKNHYILLKALRYLKDQYTIEIPLVLTGSDKGNQSYIKDLVAKDKLHNQVNFLGFVSRDELIALYQNSLALVYPSYFGPENLPPLEAFAIGCPVIASKVSGAEEQIGEAAILFEPEDYIQLALAIKSVIDDQDLRLTLIRRGKERAARWTPRDFVNGVLAFLDNFETIRHCWRVAPSMVAENE
jgi:glycosyltransferase involved in cell wall biosynthesis